MRQAYLRVAKRLASRSINAYFQAEDQLVISRQPDPAWANRGNSFWITYIEGQWYVGTWVPIHYKLPPNGDIVGLCAEFVDRGTAAQPTLPDDLISKYGLSHLTTEERDRFFG